MIDDPSSVKIMATIKVFKLVQQFYQTLGLYSPQSNQVQSFNWRILFFSTFTILHFSVLFAFLLFKAKTIQVSPVLISFKILQLQALKQIITSNIFHFFCCCFLFNLNQEYGTCIYGTIAIAVCLLCSFETIRKIAQFLTFFKNFEDFIEKRKSFYFEIFLHFFQFQLSFYLNRILPFAFSKKNTELIEKIERMSKLIYLILVKLTTASIAISQIQITSINYFVYDMGDESFHFDGTMWFPFNPNRPVGLFTATLFECVSAFAEFSFFTPIGCVYIGSCWSIVTFLKDIVKDISCLRKEKILKLTEQDLTERFCNFIQFHADVEELSGRISNSIEYKK